MNFQSRAKKTKSWSRMLGTFFVAIFCIYLGVRLAFPGLFTLFGGLLFTQDSFVFRTQAYFSDKAYLLERNQTLEQELRTREAHMISTEANRQALSQLISSIEMNPRAQVVHSSVIARPPISPYDTFILPVGSSVGIQTEQIVIAEGAYILGYIDYHTEDYARVRLFSSAGHTQTVDIDGFLFDSVGQGAGVIKVRLPRNFADTSGQLVRIPGAINYILGQISITEFDPQDSYVTGIITLAANMYTQRFVGVSSESWTDVTALELELFNNLDDEISQNSDTQ